MLATSRIDYRDGCVNRLTGETKDSTVCDKLLLHIHHLHESLRLSTPELSKNGNFKKDEEILETLLTVENIYYSDFCRNLRENDPMKKPCNDSENRWLDLQEQLRIERGKHMSTDEFILDSKTFLRFVEMLGDHKVKNYKSNQCDSVSHSQIIKGADHPLCSYFYQELIELKKVLEKEKAVQGGLQTTSRSNFPKGVDTYLERLERVEYLQAHSFKHLCSQPTGVPADLSNNYCLDIARSLPHLKKAIQLEKQRLGVVKVQATSPSENLHTIMTENASPIKNITSFEATQEGAMAEKKQNICETYYEGFLTEPDFSVYANMIEAFNLTDFSFISEQAAQTVRASWGYLSQPANNVLNTLQTGSSFILDIQLKNFTLLPEYFIGISIFYRIILVIWFFRYYYILTIQNILREIFEVCFLYYNNLLKGLNSSFYKAILSDGLSKLTDFTFSFFSAIYFINLAKFFKERKLTSTEYTLLLGFSIVGLLVLCCGN
jgi:hypothetical protein